MWELNTNLSRVSLTNVQEYAPDASLIEFDLVGSAPLALASPPVV
jgi:hypothetical protein